MRKEAQRWLRQAEVSSVILNEVKNLSPQRKVDDRKEQEILRSLRTLRMTV